MRKLELLAPAGDLEKLKIAVDYGADAVYFGGEMFSLRAGAGNLTIDEIKDFMFVVTDKNGTSYGFTFEEKPDGLESVSNGDTVIVKYIGIISEVDPFEGEVISVEKAK